MGFVIEPFYGLWEKTEKEIEFRIFLKRSGNLV